MLFLLPAACLFSAYLLWWCARTSPLDSQKHTVILVWLSKSVHLWGDFDRKLTFHYLLACLSLVFRPLMLKVIIDTAGLIPTIFLPFLFVALLPFLPPFWAFCQIPFFVFFQRVILFFYIFSHCPWVCSIHLQLNQVLSEVTPQHFTGCANSSWQSIPNFSLPTPCNIAAIHLTYPKALIAEYIAAITIFNKMFSIGLRITKTNDLILPLFIL